MSSPSRTLTPRPPLPPPPPSLPGRGGERQGSRFFRWLKILSAYFTAQTLTQLLGIASGLLFVNFMPVREYALYTLATSVLTFFSFVSDLGSTSALVHFYHRTGKEGGDFRGYHFQGYYGAVLSLRRAAFFLGAAGVALTFPWMAAAKGFRMEEAALAAAAIVAGVAFQIPVSLRVLALRLEDLYARSYQAEMAGAGLRLVLAGVLVALGWLQAWLAVFTTTLGSVLSFCIARLGRGDDPGPPDLRPYRRDVLRYLLPTLPSALYFAIQGPLTVWLAATFGGTRNIAEVGALGRLGLLVGIFSSLTGVVFLPRLARITDDRLYFRRALQFGVALAGLALALLLSAAAAPDLLLLLLGSRYSGLHRELLLALAASSLALLDGYAVAVNLARSWTRWQGAALASLVAVQAGLMAVLPLSTTGGVLTFNVLSSAAALAGQLVIAAVGFTRPRWVEWR